MLIDISIWQAKTYWIVSNILLKVFSKNLDFNKVLLKFPSLRSFLFLHNFVLISVLLWINQYFTHLNIVFCFWFLSSQCKQNKYIKCVNLRSRAIYIIIHICFSICGDRYTSNFLNETKKLHVNTSIEYFLQIWVPIFCDI